MNRTGDIAGNSNHSGYIPCFYLWGTDVLICMLQDLALSSWLQDWRKAPTALNGGIRAIIIPLCGLRCPLSDERSCKHTHCNEAEDDEFCSRQIRPSGAFSA